MSVSSPAPYIPPSPQSTIMVNLPEHATVMRSLSRKISTYEIEGKWLKAELTAFLFVAAAPVTCAKYLIQAPLCALYEFAHLRNGFTALDAKVKEAVSCLVFAFFWDKSGDDAVATNQRQFRLLQEELLRKDRKIEQQAVHISQLKKQLPVSESEQKQQADEIKKLKETLRAKQEQVQRQGDEIAELKKPRREPTVAQLHEQLSEKDKEIGKLNELISRKERQKAVLKQTVAAKLAEANGIKDLVKANLDTSTALSPSDFELLEQAVTTRQREIADLQETIRRARSGNRLKARQLPEHLSHRDEQMLRLRVELKHARDAATAMQQELKQLKAAAKQS